MQLQILHLDEITTLSVSFLTLGELLTFTILNGLSQTNGLTLFKSSDIPLPVAYFFLVILHRQTLKIDYNIYTLQYKMKYDFVTDGF